MTTANQAVRDKVVALVGLVVAPDVAVGLTCSPLAALGVGKTW